MQWKRNFCETRKHFLLQRKILCFTFHNHLLRWTCRTLAQICCQNLIFMSSSWFYLTLLIIHERDCWDHWNVKSIFKSLGLTHAFDYSDKINYSLASGKTSMSHTKTTKFTNKTTVFKNMTSWVTPRRTENFNEVVYTN